MPHYFELPVEQRDNEFVDRDKIRDMLRAKWCLKNYPSFENSSDTCRYLTRAEAKKQLQNISVDLDELENLSYEPNYQGKAYSKMRNGKHQFLGKGITQIITYFLAKHGVYNGQNMQY
jgi:hypothetical protein